MNLNEIIEDKKNEKFWIGDFPPETNLPKEKKTYEEPQQFPTIERPYKPFEIYCTVRNIGGTGIDGGRNTHYIPLDKNDRSIGITHHEKGIGKLKIHENGNSYGVPLTDIELPMNQWRIEKY